MFHDGLRGIGYVLFGKLLLFYVKLTLCFTLIKFSAAFEVFVINLLSGLNIFCQLVMQCIGGSNFYVVI